MIMNSNESDEEVFFKIAEGLSQLIASDDLVEIGELIDKLEGTESDEAKKIIQFFHKYLDNATDRNELLREMVNLFEKLALNFGAKVEIYKDIQEESDKLLEKI